MVNCNQGWSVYFFISCSYASRFTFFPFVIFLSVTSQHTFKYQGHHFVIQQSMFNFEFELCSLAIPTCEDKLNLIFAISSSQTKLRIQYYQLQHQDNRITSCLCFSSLVYSSCLPLISTLDPPPPSVGISPVSFLFQNLFLLHLSNCFHNCLIMCMQT